MVSCVAGIQKWHTKKILLGSGCGVLGNPGVSFFDAPLQNWHTIVDAPILSCRLFENYVLLRLCVAREEIRDEHKSIFDVPLQNLHCVAGTGFRP